MVTCSSLCDAACVRLRQCQPHSATVSSRPTLAVPAVSICCVLPLPTETDELLAAVVQAKPVRHKLPDGQSITVHPDEAQRLGEALLQPSSLDPGFDGPDVADSAVISALAHQEPALRKARDSAVSRVGEAERNTTPRPLGRLSPHLLQDMHQRSRRHHTLPAL